jgi:hypothetical protein
MAQSLEDSLLAGGRGRMTEVSAAQQELAHLTVTRAPLRPVPRTVISA